jgi:uncharacterized membrane protein
MWASSAAARSASTVPQTLVYASYDTEQGAKNAFDAMKQSQQAGAIQIESYAVLSKDQKGHVHVQSTQKTGAIAGSVVGALVGVLGGPAGVAVGAGTGGAVGYLTGEGVGIPHEDIDAIKDSLQPGTSAVVAVVNERWVSDAERALHEGHARSVLDQQIAGSSTDEGATTPGNQQQQNQGTGASGQTQ